MGQGGGGRGEEAAKFLVSCGYKDLAMSSKSGDRHKPWGDSENSSLWELISSFRMGDIRCSRTAYLEEGALLGLGSGGAHFLLFGARRVGGHGTRGR
jgi:hypothetical protein